MIRNLFFIISVVVFISIGIIGLFWPTIFWLLIIAVPLFLLGVYDSLQKKHTLLRNFPVIGHGRYWMETIRPEIQQYFIEDNIDAFPIEREFRSVAYQRAKGQLETRPFGTQRDVYRVGYEWASHSIAAKPPTEEVPRIIIGKDRKQPYAASPLNISAMSFGALSKNAVLALNKGAKLGGFAHNTGEGGISPYHLEHGGDLIWQIGTGYFGCRNKDGSFDEGQFQQQAQQETVRMIELKLSQGAKPGHGGVLPGSKVNKEIAEARGVEIGETVCSPPGHSAFSTPIELIKFIRRLRELSGDKPVGFKLCVGRRSDVFAICKAMIETNITPDFITVDGGEGGTGAAPLEFSNSLGMPARDAWIFVHSALTGVGLRDKVKIIASGKIISGFHMIRAMALGADICYSARGMMLALGCIQSLRCNNNHCPTGITTQNPALYYGLDVTDKSQRVARFHKGTVKGALELLGAMGMEQFTEIKPHHIFRRIDDLRVRNLSELYDFLQPEQLLNDDNLPEDIRTEWEIAKADSWSLEAEQGQYGDHTVRET